MKISITNLDVGKFQEDDKTACSCLTPCVWKRPLRSPSSRFCQIKAVLGTEVPATELFKLNCTKDVFFIDDDDYIDYMTTQLPDLERNSRFDFGFLSDYLLDEMFNFDALSDHYVEMNENDDDVLKYLKIRTHHAPAKDGVNPEVIADVAESEMMCAICQSDFEHEENIGTLQCGHEYHTDCIKQWLLRKKDCPMCRASILP
ncbi:hypothetical protein HAX54_051966 [Datura stramonium]|uniref:RING-type E3 ubiquitin transferase n=1 Tax=Datura stramonium TaxID=4076 RepID=A0ABS8SYC0_DATST|nr:hypothetical protein [Datura stramonium]